MNTTVIYSEEKSPVHALPIQYRDYSQMIVSIIIFFMLSILPLKLCAIHIHRAIEKNDFELAKKFILENPEVVNRKSFAHGYSTPLHIAILKDNPEIVQLLLSNGADPNINTFCERPLHDAVSYGNIKIVELLLQNGADANAKDNHGNDAFLIALKKNRRDIVEIILKYSDSEINLAAWRGDYETCRTILNTDSRNANHRGISGRTPLHIASFNNQAKVADLLLIEGSDINSETDIGRMPIHCAAYSGGVDVIELLLSKGSKLNPRTNNYLRNTPLHESAETGNLEVVRVLLEHGAGVNSKAFMDWTPLHVTACYNRINVVNLLLAEGADPNALTDPRYDKAKKGKTPLDIAKETGNDNVVRILRSRTSFFPRGIDRSISILFVFIIGVIFFFITRKTYLKKKINNSRRPNTQN